MERVTKRQSIMAVRVTADNIREIATWCGGELCVVFLGGEADRIRLYDGTAKIGDYVVHEDGKFLAVTEAVYGVLYQPEGE